MRNVLILLLLVGLGAGGFLLVKKVKGLSARNTFVDRVGKLSSEVQRASATDSKWSADQVADVMRGFVEASPEVTLLGELETEVVPFACGGKDEPAALKELTILDRGNARNLAIRCRGVDLIGVRGRFKAGSEVFDAEGWTYVYDH